MKNRVDVRALLTAYEKIKTLGTPVENGKQLDNITCTESYDGYSVSLSDGVVSVDVNFHNTYHFHTLNEDPDTVINQTTTDFHHNNETQIQAFLNKLHDLNTRY